MTLRAWITTMRGQLREWLCQRLCCHTFLRLQLQWSRQDVNRLDLALDRMRTRAKKAEAEVDRLRDAIQARGAQ
jgi:hypothetical protein